MSAIAGRACSPLASLLRGTGGLNPRSLAILLTALFALACAQPRIASIVEDPSVVDLPGPLSLAPAAREVRIRREGGIALPGPMLRIIQRPDGSVHGEYIVPAYATSSPAEDSASRGPMREAREALAREYGCRTAVLSDDELFCRAPFPRRAPAWRALLRTLDSLRIEEPRPAPTPPPPPPSDSGRTVIRGVCFDGSPGPTVYVLRAGRMIRYGYGGCGELSPERQQHADALTRILATVDSLARVGWH